MVGLLMVQAHRAQRGVDAIEPARRGRIELAALAGAAAEGFVIGDGLREVGHADADFVQAADAARVGGGHERKSAIVLTNI